jgi:predicted NAD-dependent protein-ADP-ribosyltransferase YbiA (DUF1768 family)
MADNSNEEVSNSNANSNENDNSVQNENINEEESTPPSPNASQTNENSDENSDENNIEETNNAIDSIREDIKDFYKGVIDEIEFYDNIRRQEFKGESVKNKTYEKHYDYDDDGNMIIFINDNKEVENTINLPNYTTTTSDERKELDEDKKSSSKKQAEDYELKRVELKTLYEKYKSQKDSGNTKEELLELMRDIIDKNKELRISDNKLQKIDTPLRDIISIKGAPQNLLDFDKPYENRITYDIKQLIKSHYILQEYYVGITSGTTGIEVEDNTEENSNRIVKRNIIFVYKPDTNDYGFMSIEFPSMFTYNDTEYESVIQALYLALFKSFSSEGIKAIKDAKEYEIYTHEYYHIPKERYDEEKKNLVQILNREKFNQNPVLKEKLLLTGNALIAADVPGDQLLGIGIGMDNIKSKNPKNWTGQNILGKTLMGLRDIYLKERRQISMASVQQPKATATKAKPKPKSIVATATEAVSSATDAVVDTLSDAVSAVTLALSPVQQAGENKIKEITNYFNEHKNIRNFISLVYGVNMIEETLKSENITPEQINIIDIEDDIYNQAEYNMDIRDFLTTLYDKVLKEKKTKEQIDRIIILNKDRYLNVIQRIYKKYYDGKFGILDNSNERIGKMRGDFLGINITTQEEMI